MTLLCLRDESRTAGIVGSRTRGPSDDELGARQGHWAGGWLGPFDHLQELGQDALGNLVQIDADCGQWHHLELSLRNIVEADNRYVAGDLPPCLVKRPQDSHCH